MGSSSHKTILQNGACNEKKFLQYSLLILKKICIQYFFSLEENFAS